MVFKSYVIVFEIVHKSSTMFFESFEYSFQKNRYTCERNSLKYFGFPKANLKQPDKKKSKSARK